MRSWSRTSAEHFHRIGQTSAVVDGVTISATSATVVLTCEDARISIERETFKKLYGEFTRLRPTVRTPAAPKLCRMCLEPVKLQGRWYCSMRCVKKRRKALMAQRALERALRHSVRRERPKPTPEIVSKLVQEWSKETA